MRSWWVRYISSRGQNKNIEKLQTYDIGGHFTVGRDDELVLDLEAGRERDLQEGVREEKDGEGEEVLSIAQAETGRETEEPGVSDRRSEGDTSAWDCRIDRYSEISQRTDRGKRASWSTGVSSVAMEQLGWSTHYSNARKGMRRISICRSSSKNQQLFNAGHCLDAGHRRR